MSKFLFWIFVIILGFISLPISFCLLVLHYLPKILQDFSQSNLNQVDSSGSQINYYSRDTLEESR
jgi:predicted Zn-dependent protease